MVSGCMITSPKASWVSRGKAPHLLNPCTVLGEGEWEATQSAHFTPWQQRVLSADWIGGKVDHRTCMYMAVKEK
jgi:hypothetical protein